jgi:hypothetical protein
MSNKQDRLPFLGIVAIGASLNEVAKAYRNVVVGKSAHAVTDAAGSFLFISNVDPDDVLMTNPLTGDIDLREVPQALAAVQFRSESSGKVPVHYTICSQSNGNGCGTHIMYDSKDAMNYCPVCNEPVTEKTEGEVSDLMSFKDLSSDEENSSEIDDSDLDDGTTETELTSESASDEEDDEDIQFNDISDDDEEDDEEDEDYEAEASGSDESGINLEEMSDEEIAEFEGESAVSPATATATKTKTPAKFQSKSEVESKEEFSLSDQDIEDIRRELESEVKMAANKPVATATASSTSTKTKLNNFVVISRSQEKALDKFKSVVLGTKKLSAVASADVDAGILTLSGDAKAFKFNPFTGNKMVKVKEIEETKNKAYTDHVLKALSSNDDYAFDVADLFQCSSSDCGIFMLSSSEASTFCPICSSEMVNPDDLEESIIPVETEETNEVLASDQENDQEISDFDIDEFLAESTTDTIAKDMSVTASSEEPTVEETATEEVSETDDNISDDQYETIEASDQSVKASANTLSLSLLASAITTENNTKHNLLNVVYCGDLNLDDNVKDGTWSAFYQGQPIAYATLASAIKHKDIFNDPIFAEATIASAKENGITTALKDMGFKPFNVSVKIKDSISKLVASQVKEAVLASETTSDEKVKEYDDRLLAALSTAAIGINRGFFKNLSNPVKAALWNSLSAAGVRNPEVLIDNVFSAQADSYHKVLFDKAREIVAKPVEIQNELTAAVVDSNYIGTSSSSTVTEDRLSSMGRVVETSSSANSMTSTSRSEKEESNLNKRILSVVSTLGRRA